ncbi:MAG TPA: hypothetical protein VD886_20300, partial [Herpetosiphonaceae bacterium]|nr:hypothetical protein [Herpetosiphonaceae bacterium]
MHRLVRPAHGLLMVTLLGLLVPVASMLILDRLGGALTRGATAAAAAVGCAAVGLALAVGWRRGGYRLAWSWADAGELAVLAAALLGGAGYLLWLAGPPFLPVGTS